MKLKSKKKVIGDIEIEILRTDEDCLKHSGEADIFVVKTKSTEIYLQSWDAESYASGITIISKKQFNKIKDCKEKTLKEFQERKLKLKQEAKKKGKPLKYSLGYDSSETILLCKSCRDCLVDFDSLGNFVCPKCNKTGKLEGKKLVLEQKK